MSTLTSQPTMTAPDAAAQRGEHRVVILLENLPLSRDARVRRQCRALLDAGYQVSVICPRGDDDRMARTLPGVRLHTFGPPPEGDGALGYLREYTVASVSMAALLAKVAVTEGVDAIQACNPPDLFFVHAAPFRLVGRPFVFDHHDLSPELYTARTGRRGLLRWILEKLEWLTFRTADSVIATNESVREIALRRGGKQPADVTVVRNGPELSRDLPPAREAPTPGSGVPHQLVWLGVMGPDDGVDLALRAMSHLVHDLGRRDVHAEFLGDGEWAQRLRGLAADLDIEPFVSFPGWVDPNAIPDHLSRASLGLAPDPAGPRADTATMMKVMDYLAAGLPVVAFDVHETRVSAGDAGVYVAENDPAAYARAVATLLDDPDRRGAMAEIGRRRIDDELAWEHQVPAYIDVYDRLLGIGGTR
jgi:glycosyltransferase involved in cell wall biosynthesis